MADSATSSVEPHLPTATFVELYVYGIYTCLFVFSALVLIKKFKNSATNKCLAAAMSAMYIIAGAHVVGESIKESSAFVPSNKVARFIEVETSLNFVFSDAIVIWRAYIIWARSRRVLLVPLVLLLITLITSLYRIICMTTADFDALSDLVPIAYMISLFASFLNNVAVTGLIGYRALHYRSSSEVQIRVYRDRSLAILLLLVESGALYCAFWVVAIVIGFAVGTVFSAKYVCVEVQGSFGTKLSCTLLSSKTVMIFTALSPHVTASRTLVLAAIQT
ncbi:hypothetical protein FA95DRAFT_1556336 [Auriscalpium vulgare]|uniref:Uncharacterized protein n=1 Tax=Auriscalpium vulgare TaxID=40419 RepID=A0ACB8S067_9AGAM|nr:hypothetical protein FA95DRAFT_1556336 [Auriscalpium vulgare]